MARTVIIKAFVAILICSSVIQFSSCKRTGISLSELWESDTLFSMPESVVFDSVHNCLFVSNLNDKGGFRNDADTILDEYISKVDLEGNVIDLHWVGNLLGPTGLTIHNDILYVIERGNLVLINIEEGKIDKRIPIVNAGFLNDLVIDENGDVYISDSDKGYIYRIRDNIVELWMNDILLEGVNGLYIVNSKIIAGTGSANNLISISIPDKEIHAITTNFSKGIDGIRRYNGEYIVSWYKKIYSIDDSGSVYKLFDTEDNKEWCADFELIKSRNIIIVPTLESNKLIAFKINIQK